MDPVSAIDRNTDRLAVPGVLTVRPGTVLRDGWPTTTPAVVVTVREAGVAADLPSTVDGVAVDVRVASEAKRLRVEDPSAYVARYGTDPDSGAVPEFAAERTVAGASGAGDASVTGGATSAASGGAATDATTGERTTASTHQGSRAPDATGSLRPLTALPDRWAALHATEGATATDEAAGERAASRPEVPYTPASVPLSPVDGTLTIQVSASPDAGWGVLRSFLAATQQQLTVGMYDFTSAHVLDAVQHATTGHDLRLVLDHPAKNPTADQTDEQTVAALRTALGSGLDQAWALERMDPFAAAWVFPSAYHIKVAVRDSATTWLSSGNWNNSNQPAIDPVTDPGDATTARTSDRDWHVVVEHPALAGTFEAYIEHDLEVAAAHDRDAPAVAVPDAVAPQVETPPFAQFFPAKTITGAMRITPLLTPDPGVYVDAVRALVDGAQHTLHMQFQYIKLPTTTSVDDQAFVDLVGAVIARQRAGVEVQVICSQWQTAGYLEQLQTAGLDLSAVRIQGNVHNKGIVVDGHTTLVSSQNWSSDGVLHNRDAGVVIENDEVAAYFDALFAHDWAHLAAQQTAAD